MLKYFDAGGEGRDLGYQFRIVPVTLSRIVKFLLAHGNYCTANR